MQPVRVKWMVYLIWLPFQIGLSQSYSSCFCYSYSFVKTLKQTYHLLRVWATHLPHPPQNTNFLANNKFFMILLKWLPLIIESRQQGDLLILISYNFLTLWEVCIYVFPTTKNISKVWKYMIYTWRNYIHK